jgi:hypothetical protein
METIIVEITLWDKDKADALVAKIEADSRVLSVKRVDV